MSLAESDHLKIDKDNFVFLTGRANTDLAKKVAEKLGVAVHNPITAFADGEIRVRIPVNMRRRHVYILQSTSTPVNDHLMELLLMIDAARRASAAEIIAIIPYFGYARQDRKEMSRVPISASLVASLLETAGVDRILTLDIHTEQSEGFVNLPWDNVYGSYSLIPAIVEKKLENVVVASPDKGGVVRATGYSNRLHSSNGIAIVYKQRDLDVNNKSEALAMIGDVNGKDVLLVDDMIDAGGTIVNAANYIKEQGAKSVRAAVTHGLFSGPAMQRISESAIEEIICTDTIQHREEVINNPKISVVSVAEILARAIKRLETGESISSLILE